MISTNRFATILFALLAGPSLALAQGAGGPAELPPADFSGGQYVDSLGCTFVRAGIDGAVTWVPLLDRNRQPVCAAPPVAQAPTEPPAASPAPQPLPAAAARAEPDAAPEPQARTARVAAATPAPGAGRHPIQRAATQPQQVRVLPRHVYDNRQNTVIFNVPEGYRPVWDDGRLNPRRAERTFQPAQPRAARIPQGFRNAWQDGRLNPQRGVTTGAGDAMTDRLWTNRVPRELRAVPTDRPIVQRREEGGGVLGTEVGRGTARLSTRATEAPAAFAVAQPGSR